MEPDSPDTKHSTPDPEVLSPGPPGGKTVYFAYGSNLSLAQMKQRCPASTYYGLGVLRNWKWLIMERGYANVMPTPRRGSEKQSGDVVYGMLYLLEPTDEDVLDACEGVPYCYRKEFLIVDVVSLDPSFSEQQATEEKGREGVSGGVLARLKALVYVDVENTEDGAILPEYIGRMNRGIKDAMEKGMPETYVKKYLRKWVTPQTDEDKQQEREAEDRIRSLKESIREAAAGRTTNLP